MIGSRQRMPKRARYPLFLLGLAIILLGGIVADWRGAPEAEIVAIVVAGFAFLVASILFR